MKPKLWLSFLTIIVLIPNAQIAKAQTYQPSNRTPVADSTLGTQVSGTGNNFNITGGLNRGQTLFHSFTDFSVPTNGQANFTKPVGNRDIITRVTGGVFSDINGLVNTNGANFFLINPSGIVFGTGAQLNVGKAFVGTTANSIDLVDGSGRLIKFGTNPNSDAPLLSVAPNVMFDVSRLTMGGGNGQISNFGTLQTTNNSQYIGLIGGNVTLDGGKIIAPGGRVDIGGLNSAGAVSVNSDGLVFDGISLSRSDVALSNGASVSVRANDTLSPVNPVFFPNAISPGSSINISGNKISISNSGDRFIANTSNSINQSLGGLDAGLDVNSGVKTGKIGNITLDATGDITIQKSALFNLVRSGAEGTGGGIKITGNNIAISDKSEISTTLAQNAVGSGGNIDITARGNFNFSQLNYPDVTVALLDANTESTADSLISASTYGSGDSGKITIAAGGDAVVSDNSAISSSVSSTGLGSSGGIKIDANSLIVRNGGQILTSVEGTTNQPGNTKHNSGNIDVTTKGDLTIFGSNTIANLNPNNYDRFARIETNSFRTGDAGKVTITSGGKLSILNRGEISSSIRKGGTGTGGGITIDAREILISNLSHITSYLGGRSLDGRQIYRREPNAWGQSGDININAIGDITIDESFDGLIAKEFNGNKTPPSQITNTIHGTGKGGKITINTRGKVTLGNNNGILSTVEPGGEGDPGGITINAGDLDVYNEGLILTTASLRSGGKRGNAGDINIKTTGNITVEGNRNPNVKETKGNSFYAKIASDSGRNGDAGTITIDAGGDILLINKGGIITECKGDCKAQAGNRAGTIAIKSNRLIFDRGDISLNSNDNAGNITIDTRDSILMRRNSRIFTNSQGNGNGGNITINTKFLIAIPTENNDITASAIKGQGGNVTIDAQGVFGIQFRPLRTPNSDIIVSSEFGQSGNVNIDTPGADPGRDSTELPNTTTDASTQISQACSASTRDNKLILAGRGGLPPNAYDPLTSDVVWQDARATSSQPAASNAPTNQLTPPAVGMVFDGKGKVTLIAAGIQAQPGTKAVCLQGKK